MKLGLKRIYFLTLVTFAALLITSDLYPVIIFNQSPRGFYSPYPNYSPDYGPGFNSYQWRARGVVVYPEYYYTPPALHYYMPGVYQGPGTYYDHKSKTYFNVPQPYYNFYPY